MSMRLSPWRWFGLLLFVLISSFPVVFSIISRGKDDLLTTVFTTHLPSSHILSAIKHEEYHELTLFTNTKNDTYYLICIPYQSSNQFYQYLNDFSTSADTLHHYHPIFHSKKVDQSCLMTTYSFINMITTIEKINLSPSSITVTKIPHILKLHQSTLLSSSKSLPHRPITIELSYGFGVNAKGFYKQSIHEYSRKFLHLATQILSDQSLLEKHWNQFYWTTNSKYTKNIQKNLLKLSELRIPSEYLELLAFTSQQSQLRSSSPVGGLCNFHSLQIQTTKSHILYTTTTTTTSEILNINCIKFLTTVASLQSEISFISISYGESLESITERSNTPYENADPATDQNAWIQSGTSTETPYSDIGIDGTGYLLGMIGKRDSQHLLFLL